MCGRGRWIEIMGLGIGIPWQFHELHSPSRVLSALPVGVWCDWRHQAQYMSDSRYLPMFWTGKIGGELTGAMEVAAEFPGRVWLFGNEPEREGPESAQATPAEFAEAVEMWVQRFGRHTLALPGVQLTEQGIAWLDEYVRIGGIIPSKRGFWNFKLYPGHVEDADRAWKRALSWMTRHRVHRRVILSEFAGMTLDVFVQRDLMLWAMHKMAADRWFTDALWFCSYYGETKYVFSRLFDARGKLTMGGELFRTALLAQDKHSVYLPKVSA
jgi:hypothetical protein